MTGRGAGLAAAGTAAIVVGLLLNWSVLIAMGVILVLLLLVPLMTRGPVSAYWRDRSAPTRVVRGDAADIVIDVTMPSRSTGWVSAVDALQTDRVFLPAGTREITLTWPIDTSLRGQRRVGPSRLEVGDPFGISRRVLTRRDPSDVLVVPRVHHLDVKALSAAAPDGDDGERAGSEQFHSLREYVVGDPQKLVHWRSSARAGKLMVRRMVDTTVPWLLVVLDVNRRAYDREAALFEDFDAAAFEESVDTAASWAWHGCSPTQRVLLTTTSVSDGRPAHAAEVTARTRESALDWLALVAPLDASDCGPARVAALARKQGVGRVVLITGRHVETSAPWVRGWQRAHPVTLVLGHA